VRLTVFYNMERSFWLWGVQYEFKATATAHEPRMLAILLISNLNQA